MIPTVVAGMAVTVAFSISFIVLLVVGNQIVERKAVMRGDKIDAGPGPAAAGSNKSLDPVNRPASSGSMPSSPRQ